MIDFKVKENLKESGKAFDLFKQIEKLKKVEILVGIPEERAPRKRGEMNNATLLYIHTQGSPLKGLPARPLIEPCLRDRVNADKLADDLRLVGQAVLEENLNQARRLMKVTGQDAVNMIRDWFGNPLNGWEPIKPATLDAKLKKKKGLSINDRRQMIDDYESGVEGINTTLVDTGQLRKSITYVLREK